MRTTFALALIVGGIVAAGLVAGAQGSLVTQGQPDFTGQWVRDGVPRSSMTVIQNTAVISITYDGLNATAYGHATAYGLDGREVRRRLPGPPPREGLDYVVTTGAWRGADLLLVDTYAWGSVQTQVWSLDASGVLHIEIIKGPDSRNPRHTVTFKRQ